MMRESYLFCWVEVFEVCAMIRTNIICTYGDFRSFGTDDKGNRDSFRDHKCVGYLDC